MMIRQRVPRVLSVILCLTYLPVICMSSKVHHYIKPSESPCPYADPSCLTLEQVSENISQYSNSNTSLTLEILPGNHSLSSSMFIQNITFLKLFSQTKNVYIICTDLARFGFMNVTTVEFTNLTFHGCGPDKWSTQSSVQYAVLSIYSSNLYIKECKLHHSKQLIVFARFCNITIYKSEFINSSRGIFKAYQCNITDSGSNFSGCNRKGLDSTISAELGYLKFSSCRFNRNGPLLYVRYTTVFLHTCELTENMGNYVFFVYDKNIILESSHFYGNVGWRSALYMQRSNLTLKNTTLLKNEAHIGPVFLLRRSLLVTFDDIIIEGNTPRNNSVSISIEDSVNTSIAGKLIFKNNWGFFLISNSKVTFHGQTMFLNNYNSNSWLSTVSTVHEGGAVVCIGSTVQFVDSVTFLDNYSRKNGGALSAVGSKIFVHKNILLAKNEAQYNGGGIYLFVSHFICGISCNFSENIAERGDGGGIHAVDSIVFLGGECSECVCIHYKSKVSLIFRNNSAVRGGGIYFEANSELRGPKDDEISFENNDARTDGKAIYVNDSTYLATCSQHRAQCFLQTSPPKYSCSRDKCITIIGNFTNLKTTIFGGQLDNCIVNNAFSDRKSMNGIKYLRAVTGNPYITRIITSNPVRACFCINGMTADCSPLSIERMVQKGESFNVTVIAVDQVNSSVNAFIFSDISHHQVSRLGTNQSYQHTRAMCTNLTFNVYSSRDHTEKLSIRPDHDSQCSNKEDERTLSVHITFKKCACPIGFHVNKHNRTSCECECDPRISPYKKQCNLSSVVRSSGAQGWISYNNGTGFLVHPFCPYDFCLPPAISVSIDLNFGNGSDTQCASNRTGLLCGKCKSGYSLSLSSSHCVHCPEINWPYALLIITVKIIAGIVLVATILMLNLTVSVGTLNGLIFYANVLAADRSLFLSFSEPNFHTIFIAWFNLDLGFDVCYFKGIDAYAKVWLNIFFPTYMITVLLLIILISKYSSRFGRFIGRWNPVATLATLLLLSYTKLLRAIITILSFTVITYPTGQQETVWLQDASVKFFGDKHFPLGLLAIIVVIFGFIYTVLLFCWQWLLRLPNRRIFKWVRNTRLNLFMEANLAPYNAKYRYWYGSLLFVRMALYLGIATEKSHESVTIVLVIGLIAASIQLLRTFLGNDIYRKRFVGYLNSTFYYNLLALSLARLFCQNSTLCQKRASKISISLAFILFVLILSYHILRTLLEIRRFRYIIASVEQMLRLRRIDDPNFMKLQEPEMQEEAVILPTSTEIAISPCKHSSDHEISDTSMSKILDAEGACCSEQDSDPSSVDQSNVVSEETTLNDCFDNKEIVRKQKIRQKGKRWTNSNTLQKPLLQD